MHHESCALPAVRPSGIPTMRSPRRCGQLAAGNGGLMTTFTDDVVPVRAPIDAPEPGLTIGELLARAAAMRDEIRAESPETEARGGYSPERHKAFTEAGFYRMLQPRRYGGYEVALDDF